MEETRSLSVAEGSVPPDKPRMSRGEKLFNTIVYGPVAFTATFVLSAILAVVQKRKAPFITDNMVDWFKKVKVPDAIAEASAPVILTSWGGTLALFPIKWMENRKAAMVDRFNRWLGDKTDKDHVVTGDSKGWGSLILGRIAVIGIVWPVMSVVGGLIGPLMGRGEHATGTWLANRFKVPTHRNLPPALPARAAELNRKIAALGKDGAKEVIAPLKKELTKVTRLIEKHETVHYTLGRMLAVDAIVTAVAVVTLYFTSTFFAGKSKARAEVGRTEPADIAVTAPEETEGFKKQTITRRSEGLPSDAIRDDNAPRTTVAERVALQTLATESPMRSA